MIKIKEMADISVIIPVYNSGKKLLRAIESILEQSIYPKEVIIIDDYSNDIETKDILNEIANEKYTAIYFRVIYSTKNNGPGSARNLGWERANGRYIAFLDSDDIWHPNKLEVQYQYMENNPEIIFSCHHMDVLNPDSDYKEFINEKIISKTSIININPIRYLFIHYPRGGTSFVMIHRDIPLRFFEGKHYSEDYLLWLEINFNYRGVLLNNVMAYSFKERYGEGGLSNNLWAMENGELETFKVIREKGYINEYIYIFVIVFSLFKYICREIVCRIK